MNVISYGISNFYSVFRETSAFNIKYLKGVKLCIILHFFTKENLKKGINLNKKIL